MADIHQELKNKLQLNYQQFYQEWIALSPETLIERSEEIAATIFMCKNALSECDTEDAAFLLRFRNPLEVLRDKWIEENGSEACHHGELWHALQSLLEDGQDYELEPDTDSFSQTLS